MPLLRLLLVGLGLVLLGCDDLHSPGSFNRQQMESLVKQVRAQWFAGEKDFCWQEISGKPRLVADKRQNQIFARKDAQKNLTAVILLHHGGRGSAGFAYSDTPFTRLASQGEAPAGGCSLDLPGPMQAADPRRQLDVHWWPVWDNVN